MLEHILREPLWLQAWIFWLILVNSAALFFLRHREARWVLIAWALNVVTMETLVRTTGYNRFLGISHVVWWTPLLITLWRQRGWWPGVKTAAGRWVRILVATNLASLVIDYVDVVRYLLGDRS